MQNIRYYRKRNNIECIFYENAVQSYPVHTHAKHVTLGYILDGEVCIICDGEKSFYHTGDSFCILPDILHPRKWDVCSKECLQIPLLFLAV